jgi:hypothetical protein
MATAPTSRSAAGRVALCSNTDLANPWAMNEDWGQDEENVVRASVKAELEVLAEKVGAEPYFEMTGGPLVSLASIRERHDRRQAHSNGTLDHHVTLRSVIKGR